MSQIEGFDVLVFGSGAGGKLTAWTSASEGLRTAVVERRLIGGSCPNIACLPTKNVIHSAKVADFVRHDRDFGSGTAPSLIEMAEVRARKRRMVDGLVSMHMDKYKESGAELVFGEGSFVASKTIQVRLNNGGVRTLHGERVFLNLGTHAVIPDIPGLRASKPLTHVEALELDRIPTHLIVLGGGYVGLEFAQAFVRFGSRVTILERGPQLLAREDRDVADALLEFLHLDGVDIRLNVGVAQVEGSSGDSVRVTLTTSAGTSVLEGSDILVASGRTPNTQNIGLDKTGVATDARGYVQVNDRLETSAAGIWALGECAGSPHFTHVSEDDFRIVQANLHGGSRNTRDRLIPFCLFTDPEIARVGLNENEAVAAGRPYRVAKLPMQAVLRARTLSETRGFMKALVSQDTDEIIGFTAMGPHAGEILAVVQTAMMGKLPYTALRDAVFTHPTMAEGLGPLFGGVPARTQASAHGSSPST
ncbi:MAG TPA: mercuric reductase [Bryobacteraceae bacterium]|jgi:pyruvate/2-oxoglutarate dehydrogenase complex dihydrolipoamide dehydrogenase (E3) component|nr:mercuric reductase [Bryobacteraceae bacterium]